MILAVDVDYRDEHALVAGVCFQSWKDQEANNIVHSLVSNIEKYESGSFYKREMPCIIQLINDHNLNPDIIVIDGFVTLGLDSSPGLGMHLYKSLSTNTPIIGVAKKPFKDTNSETEILRGNSLKPLYVTSVGIDENTARNSIAIMHGKYRLPTLLKLVDRECRQR